MCLISQFRQLIEECFALLFLVLVISGRGCAARSTRAENRVEHLKSSQGLLKYFTLLANLLIELADLLFSATFQLGAFTHELLFLRILLVQLLGSLGAHDLVEAVFYSVRHLLCLLDHIVHAVAARLQGFVLADQFIERLL